MGPVTHLLLGWTLANCAKLERRDRALVTIAGVAPDIDGFGAIVDICTSNSDSPTEWFSEYHHILGHNIGLCLIYVGIAVWLARRRSVTVGLAVLSLLVHIVADIAGGRGPDGYQWPIPFLLPFSDAWSLHWAGQWGLNAWQNFTVTGVLLVLTVVLAWRRGFSVVEIVSKRADEAFVSALRRRFGDPGSSST